MEGIFVDAQLGRRLGMHKKLEREGQVLLGFVLKAGSPNTITEALGIEPDSAIHDGSRHVSRYPNGEIHEHTMSSTCPATWFSWGGWKECGSVQAQLEHWCERLHGKHEALAGILAAGAYGSLHCSCAMKEQQELTLHLPARLLESVARLGLDLNIAFTPPYAPPSAKAQDG